SPKWARAAAVWTARLPSLALQVELLDVVLAPRVELDAAHVALFGLDHGRLFFALHQVDDGRVRVHDHRVAGQRVPLAPQLAQDLVGNRRARLNLTGAVAVEARLVHRARQ